MDEGARRFGGIARLFVGLALACVGSSAAYVATTQLPAVAAQDEATPAPPPIPSPDAPTVGTVPTARCSDVLNLVDVNVPPEIVCRTMAPMPMSEDDVRCVLDADVPAAVAACVAAKLPSEDDPCGSIVEVAERDGALCVSILTRTGTGTRHSLSCGPDASSQPAWVRECLAHR